MRGRDWGGGWSMIKMGERRWSMALGLMLGAPPMALALFLATIYYRRDETTPVFIIVAALTLVGLGLHLQPFVWWKRLIVATIYYPLLICTWLWAGLVLGCFAGACMD
jgi:peptidoglycan biosynthesis protein MviN/MurJ (putative lipid II flippase)